MTKKVSKKVVKKDESSSEALKAFNKDRLVYMGPFNFLYKCNECSLEDAQKDGFFTRKECRSMGINSGDVVQLVSDLEVKFIVVR